MKARLLAIALSLFALQLSAQTDSNPTDSLVIRSGNLLAFVPSGSNSFYTDGMHRHPSRIEQWGPGHSASSTPTSRYQAFVSAGVFGTTDGTVPFWMRSQRWGSVPSDGASASLIAGASKSYAGSYKEQTIDWGAGFEGRANLSSDSRFILIEAYAKGRLGPLELKGGRYREIVGLVDSTLSSGAFAVSGNALGIPQIAIGFSEYWDVPLTNGVIAVKWKFSHGWVGSVKLNNDSTNSVLVDEIDSYLHQKSLYGRLGKDSWKIRLYGGFNHQVIWGNEADIYPNWGLSNFETFKYVFIGREYGTNSIPTSKVGNHLGSIDQALEWRMKTKTLNVYHQFFYEVGAMSKLANATDGLWGVSLKNRSTTQKAFQWHKILLEFLFTKSQGGEIDSKPRASGPEDYYNNFLYYDGWTYKGDNLGNALLTQKQYLRDELPTRWSQTVTNNRVTAIHLGSEFNLYGWYCKSLFTYSINYGTYSLSEEGFRSLGDRLVYPNPPYFPKVKQFSAYLESRKSLRNGLELGLQLAFDQGDLLYNSVGGGISLTKRW